MRLDLLHNLRILGGLLGEKNLLTVVKECGVHIHRQTDHTEVVLEEVFTRGMIRLVADEADGFTQLAYEAVSLAENDGGESRHRRRGDGLAVFLIRRHHLIIAETIASSILPRGAHLWGDLHVVQLHIVPKDNFWCLREHRQVELLGVAVHTHMDAAGINPSTAVFAWGDVVEIPDDIIAQVVLEVLCRSWITRLSARPDAIEVLRLFLEVEAETVKVVVPIRIFDDDLHVRINLLGAISLSRYSVQLFVPLAAISSSFFRSMKKKSSRMKSSKSFAVYSATCLTCWRSTGRA